MTPETIVIILFGIVILIQLCLMYVMYVRIRQLLEECDQMAGRIDLTGNELEELAKNVEELKKLKI
jgi:hypothetical protein